MKFLIPIYALILLISCSATNTGSIDISDSTKKDTSHKPVVIYDTTHKTVVINDTTRNKITVNDTTHNKITLTDTTYQHKDSVAWTTIPKDSIKWNIINKDTSLIIPLYIDKRLAPYLNDSLKIRFKITYSR